MEERARKLNIQLNNYIVRNNLENNMIFLNSILFNILATKLNSIIDVFCERLKVNINLVELPRIDIFEKFNIIKDFYKKYNINFELEKYIQDGTISFIETNINDKPFQLGGYNRYENGHKIVDYFNNGNIADIPIMVHEHSHLRNQPEKKRGWLSDFFTEALALTDELLVLDYLSELGYKEEVREYKIALQKGLYSYSYSAECLLKFFILFEQLGDVSKDSFKMYYGNTDNYEQIIEVVETELNDKNFCLDKYVWYLFANYISSYLYLKYKEDNSFIKNINQLHSLINSKDMFTCLNIIGLHDLGEEDQEILLNSVKKMIEQITKEETKTK